MKLKNTLNIAVAAAVLGSALSAQAAINTGNPDDNRNGELFLSVWDEVNRVSYVRDLGISMTDWLDGGQKNIGHTFAADSLWFDIANGTNLSGRNDSTRTDSATVGTPLAAFASTSNLYWNIVTVDYTTLEILSTSRLTSPSAAMLNTTGSDIDTAAQNSAVHSGNNNVFQPGGSTNYAVNTSNVATISDGNAYSGNNFSAGERMGGIMNWSNAARSTLDVSNRMRFYSLNDDPNDLNAPGFVSEVVAGAYWTFDGATGNLVYAVPEADTWALFGAGLVMLGAVARRKRSA